MKKSEELKLEAQREDNDLIYMSKMKKSLREANLEAFEERYIDKLELNNCIIVPFNGQKVVIDTQTEKYGIIDYFPKANKLCIRKGNQWKSYALRWLNENILKQNKKLN